MVYKSEFPPVPISNESLHAKLLNAIWSHGNLHPTNHALVAADDSSKYVTFHELHRQAHSVRAFLLERGFHQGEVASLVLSNCIEWAVFALGTMAAGGCVSGASALFTDYELERQFVDSRSTFVFTDEKHLKKYQNSIKNCPTLKTIICVRHSSSDTPLNAGVFEWHEVVSRKPDYGVTNLDLESIVALPYSSGTTGLPKGVMLTHRGVGTTIEIFVDHFNRELFGAIGRKYDKKWYNFVSGGYDRLKPDFKAIQSEVRVAGSSFPRESFVLNLPFYHGFGFGMLCANLLAGAKTVVIGKFEPQLFLAAIQQHRPRILTTVPPILLFLAKHPMVKQFDCSSLEIVLVGAAPTGKDLAMEFLAQHKNVKYLCQAYGMTETTIASHLPVLSVKDPHLGAGKPMSNFEQKIVDVSTGKELRIGESGEVWVRSPTMMKGYLNRPDATAETIDKEGWLHTGDIGYMDNEGRLYIVDRLKELIKVKGLQVAPAELEDLLLSHPLIKDAAVIGIPDRRMGEVIRAYIIRSNETVTEDDIIRFVAEKVSRHKQITGGVSFVKEIPKSPSGKILRRFLRDEVVKEMKSKI